MKLLRLIFFSLAWMSFSYFYYIIVDTGIESKLMSFESEPIEGWGFWYCYFIKTKFWELFIPVVFLVLIGLLLIKSWILYLTSNQK